MNGHRGADGAAADRPFYARALRLRHLRPSGLLCFVYLEGTLGLGMLFALAEAIPWWSVPMLPAVVAAMVKLNDVIAAAAAAPARVGPGRVSGLRRAEATPIRVGSPGASAPGLRRD